MIVKIQNADGTPGEVEIPEGATLDTKSMGLLSNEEVGSFKRKYLNEGKEKAMSEVQKVAAEKAELERKLDELNLNLSQKDRDRQTKSEQMTALQSTVEELKKALEADRAEKSQLKFEKDIRNAADGLQMLPDAFSILQSYIQGKKTDDGFMAADGTPTDIKGLVKEWASTEVGKRLTLSGERGGGGTSSDGFTGTTFADYHRAGKQSEYIQKFGREKYLKEMTAMRRMQNKTV